MCDEDEDVDGRGGGYSRFDVVVDSDRIVAGGFGVVKTFVASSLLFRRSLSNIFAIFLLSSSDHFRFCLDSLRRA